MKPSLGRIVLIWGRSTGAKPIPAIINEVHSDVTVSVTAFPFGQAPIPVTSLVEGEPNTQPEGWQWPPKV